MKKKPTHKEIRCFTTMNKNYYNEIGIVMIKTWLENFPPEYRLHLYLEDFTLDFKDTRIILEEWKDIEDLYKIWEATRFSTNSRHQKFTKKALVQITFWKKYSGKILWLDADTFSMKSIPDNFFDRVLEGYPLASWGTSMFESGTVFVDTNHPDFKPIFETYKSIYVGDLGLPKDQRWYDGEILGWSCATNGSKHLNLGKLCMAKTSTPLNRSWIGEYIRHMKAKQKNHVRESLLALERPDLAELIKSP